MKTIHFSNKVTDSVYESIWPNIAEDSVDPKRRERVSTAVKAALNKLPAGAQYLIRRYHFDGASIPEIAEEQGVSPEIAGKRHRRALLRLQGLLAAFVEKEFGLTSLATRCVICASPKRNQIDELLARHINGDRYQKEMREIKNRFGITITSVMTIIGHRMYH